MAHYDRYRRPSDMPGRLPVFPLRRAILLPRTTMPLNVFEPRYLAMVDDALRGDRLIGILQPVEAGETEDLETQESPAGTTTPLRRVGCTGRIIAYQEQDDGRLFISLKGVARFEIREEATKETLYRIVRPGYDRFAADFMEGHGEESVDRPHLLRVLRRYLDAHRLEADWPLIKKSSNEFLVNSLAMMSPYGPEEKQALLEAVDLEARATVLVALAEMDLASSGEPGGTLQ